jgi:hypothetical protein
MGLNPLKNVKEQMDAISLVNKSTNDLMRIQSEQICKQTLLMERWAIALESIADTLKNWHE